MSLPNAITREDFYLNKIANPSDDHELPDAITRQQHYLKAIAENAGGGGGGGSEVHYSTEEQIIGTWIDNRPVYEVTLTVATTTTLTNADWTVIPFVETEPTGVDFLIDAITTKNPPINSQFRFTYDNGHFCGASLDNDSINQGSFCIFRYVKTA